jgi:hypothetical protein
MKKLQCGFSGDYVSVILFALTQIECPHISAYFIESGDFPGAAKITVCRLIWGSNLSGSEIFRTRPDRP